MAITVTEPWAFAAGLLIGVIGTLIVLLLMGSAGADPDTWPRS